MAKNRKTEKLKDLKTEKLKSPPSQLFKFLASFGVLVILSIGAASPFLDKNEFIKAKESLLKNPKDKQAHLTLATEFLKTNNLEMARSELDLAEGNREVLGISSETNDLWTKWKDLNPVEVQKEIKQWERFLSQNPTYLYGWLRLARDYYKTNQPEKAKEALDQARILDPNSPDLHESGTMSP